jgi:hypothetical protein
MMTMMTVVLRPRRRPLAQADVLAGVFGSTFVKTALQLGHARTYATLDTFPWCPLLRCYWGWRDMCHNCELCYNSGGGGEACNNNGYHTAGGLKHAIADSRPARGAFRRFIATVDTDFRCRPFAEHPLILSEYDRPVVGAHYAAPMPPPPSPPAEVCASAPAAKATSAACECGFRRFAGIDNAAFAQAKPAYGYGHGVVPATTLRTAELKLGRGGGGGGATLEACERACCEDKLCHSVTWRTNTSTCVAALTIAHGARPTDWCWHPTASVHALTSIRLPGTWENRARLEASAYLRSQQLVRRGAAAGPRLLGKPFFTPVGHSHPMERTMVPAACEAPASRPFGSYEISDVHAAAVPYASQLASCPGPSPTTWVPKAKPPEARGRWRRRRAG